MLYELSQMAPLSDYIARHLAPKTSESAARSRHHLALMHRNRRRSGEMRKHFSETPLTFFAVLFILATSLSLYIGWEMYKALIQELLHVSADPWAITAFSLLLSAFSALAGHYGMLGFNKKIRQWQVAQLNHNGRPALLNESDFSREVVHYRITAFLYVVFILVLYYLLAMTRGNTMMVLHPDKVVKPVVFMVPLTLLVIELGVGSWFVLWCRWQGYRLAEGWHGWQAAMHRKVCVRVDQTIYNFLNEAKREGESLRLTTDVRDALYRVEHRHAGQEDYVAPIDDL